VRDWKLQLKADKELIDLSNMFNSVIQGWINYYGKFYKSEMYSSLRHINKALIMWARRKYKKLSRHKKRAEHFLGRISKQNPKLFKHWDIGIKPTAE
jgi:RNA-directed DNA polymerase